jgi:hypothetical protein
MLGMQEVPLACTWKGMANELFVARHVKCDVLAVNIHTYCESDMCNVTVTNVVIMQNVEIMCDNLTCTEYVRYNSSYNRPRRGVEV